MKIVDHTGSTLVLDPPPVGEHTLLLTVCEEQQEDRPEATFALRPDSAAALVGVLQAWVAERSKNGLF